MEGDYDINPEEAYGGNDPTNNKKIPKAKQQFIHKLKSFLYQYNGDSIYDKIVLGNGEEFDLNKFQASLDLDIDLINMIHYDQFLGDNFIRCFFRYYPKISQYTKDIFIEKYRENYLLKIKDTFRKQEDFLTQERLLELKIAKMQMELNMKVNLKLTHFPYSVNQINPATLLNNSLLRNHGQLVCLKLARVVNVFQPSYYLYSKIYQRKCFCKNSPEFFTQVNSNPIKIFKNQVNYSTKLGNNLYYDTVDEKDEVYCDFCQTKYTIKDQKYAPCQKTEILALTTEGKLINLSANISVLWLIEPFVSSLEIGDVINLTAYCYLCPQQQMIKEKCISPLIGSFVAFDIVKVNPFNHLIGKDSSFASLFYQQTDHTTNNTKKSGNSTYLTLENIKQHDQLTQEHNNKFLPKINRLIHLANNRNQGYKTSTNFTGTYSIFDALYDLESFNHSESQAEKDTEANSQYFSQEQYRDILIEKMLQVDLIEQDFGKIHMLVDRVFEQQNKISQNSNMFHLRLSLLLSTVVQMKNSLVKFLEHEAKEQHPNLKCWSQVKLIQDVSPDQDYDDDLNNFELYTPQQFLMEENDFSQVQCNRENISLMLIYDDATYLEFCIKSLKNKGVRIVDFPTIFDHNSLIPYLLINDHSIIVVKNPKKEIMNMLKLIMKKGIIFFKQQSQPIHVNITIWVMIDVLPYLTKVKQSDKKAPQKVQEFVQKEYGVDFCNNFDIVIDFSQYSNVDILGTDYLKYQDNYMLNKFSFFLDKNIVEVNQDNLFNYRELKCTCEETFKAGQNINGGVASLQSLSKLSVGEVFIQYYYLCQRRLHSIKDSSSNFYREEKMAASESNWMTLQDVIRVKKIADNINFMRLFFLKSSDEQINRIKMERSGQVEGFSLFNQNGLEIIDCVVSIFLFEIFRTYRAQRSLYSKDQIQFKILYFFSRLRLCHAIDQKYVGELNRPKLGRIDEASQEDELSSLIEGLDIECRNKLCANCQIHTKENIQFKNLYKNLIDDICRNIQ